MEKLLVIDDSLPFLKDMEVLLSDRYVVVTASTGMKGLEVLKTEHVAAVLLDLMLPDTNGNELVKVIHREIDARLPVLIVTDHANVESAVTAMRNGAYDFVLKSFNRNVLFEKIEKALERRGLEIRVDALQDSFGEMHNEFVFSSEVMRKIHMEITRLAGVDFDVLIEGETGVGKDLIAYEIHKRSNRFTKPFIPLAMKAYNEMLIESELFGHEKGAFSGADKAKAGKLEAADGGTIYIPEVSSLTEAVQLKLLHFMQYKTVTRVGQDPRKPVKKLDVRVLMATNESLDDVVREGKMRKDFFHRINGVKLRVPPLRERAEDIEPLTKYFLKRNARTGSPGDVALAPEVVGAFKAYGWPGNVRELENWIRNGLAFCGNKVLTLADFHHFGELKQNPDECRVCMATRFNVLPEYQEASARFKHAYFSEILKRSNNRISQAATSAGITTQALGRILKVLNIKEN